MLVRGMPVDKHTSICTTQALKSTQYYNSTLQQIKPPPPTELITTDLYAYRNVDYVPVVVSDGEGVVAISCCAFPH